MIRKVLYGWRLKSGEYGLGRNPPDSPSIPYTPYPDRESAQKDADRRRARVIWCESQTPGELR